MSDENLHSPDHKRDENENLHSPDHKRDKKKPRSVPLSVVLAGFVAVAAGIFVFQNQDNVQMEFLGFSGFVPLYLVSLISILLGTVIGWFAMYMRQRRRRHSNDVLSESD